MRRTLPLLIAALVLLGSVAAAEPTKTSFKDLEKAVKKALDAEDPAARSRAFDVLKDSKDLRCVELVIKSVKRLESDLENIRSAQATAESDYEEQWNKKLRADEWLRNSTGSKRDFDRYNKGVKKIKKKMDHLRLEQKNLENDYTRAKALIDSAVGAMSNLLESVETEDLATALQTLEDHWRNAKSVERRMRWLDALSEVDRPTIAERIRAAVKSRDLPAQMRAAALQTLGGRKDVVAFDIAMSQLDSGRTDWDMTAAAVEVLRLLHERRCIDPLIVFLGRDDLGRLRDDAHRALKSLTGQKHGPYRDPWERWWEDAKDGFRMPEKPVDPSSKPAPQEGVTFYGIHTFSDRVLFILDISGSMDQMPKDKDAPGANKPKIEVARTELLGFVLGLEPTDRFNLIFFNHEVVPWQGKMVEANESTKRRAKKWVEDQVPTGGTNIHDALEAGFAIALRATGEAVVDTIFFLTDGRPTAGKIQDAERILEAVTEWNRTARLTIHCVGVGDHDADFMEKLASIGGGEYRKR